MEASSACGALIAQTIAHLSTRVQFGALFGTNQALWHRVAEMYVERETLRALVLQALRAAAGSPAEAWEEIAFEAPPGPRPAAPSRRSRSSAMAAWA